MDYKLSVVIPIYNVEKYLDRCIQSILSQTVADDIEIILIDDGSPDNCPNICNKYAYSYPAIKVIHKSNQGLGMACNSGIDVATGDYIAFVDSDDWIEAGMYETMLEEAKRNNFDCVITGLKRVNKFGEIIEYMHHPDSIKVFSGSKIKNLMLDMISSPPSNRYDHEIQVSAKVVLYKKSIIDLHKLRFVSERDLPSEDLQFNLDYLSKCNSVIILPIYNYNYFVNDKSITQNVNENHFEKLVSLFFCIQEKISKANLGYQGMIRLSRFIIGETRSYCLRVAKSSLSPTDKNKIIGRIFNHDIWDNILNFYPIHKAPFKHQIFIAIIKFKLVKFLHLISLIC